MKEREEERRKKLELLINVGDGVSLLSAFLDLIWHLQQLASRHP